MPAKTARPARKRSYNSTRRAQQAAQTRADVLAAAIDLFDEHGWAGTTLAAIAEAAGVSVETIYNGFGSKKALLCEAMDVAVVGDTEPVPFADRPEFAALGEGELHERVARAVTLVATIHERSSGVWQAIIEASRAEPEVEAWRLEVEGRRQTDLRGGMTLAFGRPIDDQLVTLLWLLYSPESYRKLVADEAVSRTEYEALLVEGTMRLAAPMLAG